MSTVMRDAFAVTRLSFWTGVLLSTLVGAAAYAVTARSIESDAHARFVNHAKHAQNVIAVRLKSYTDLLRGTGSMIQSTDDITQVQFHEYVRGLDLGRHYPAVDYINFAAYVRNDERAAYVAKLRAEKRFLGQRAEQLDIKPAGARQSYLPVTYIEPEDKVSSMYGFDLLTNRYFGTLLLQERDDGTVHAAGTPIPALSRPNDNYLGMRIPVYRFGSQRDSVGQRRAAYIGSLGIAFSLRKMLIGVLDEIPVRGMHMRLYDVGSGLDANGHDASGLPLMLFDSRDSADLHKSDSDRDVFSSTLALDFDGCPWRIIYGVPRASLYTGFDSFYPKLMMVFGFLASILLYALLHTLTSSRRAALELAQEMTSELRESQNKLQLSHQKLRRMADHAYQIKEVERKRIAREIHDDLGQNLLALRIDAEMLTSRTRGTHKRLNGRAGATLEQIDMTIRSVRQIINDLRPTVLDLGLSAAVEWQVDQFQRRTGIVCEVHDDHGEIALPDQCATAFFRILQESLTNVVRHANATQVVVDLNLHTSWLSLSVRDNGCGLTPEGRNKFGSFGLAGIEERIVILGGTCAVFSEPDGGTTVMVSAPVVELPDHLTRQPEHSSGSAVI